jgi:hypothetical protein
MAPSYDDPVGNRATTRVAALGAVLTALAAAPIARADDVAGAQALFDQGIADLNAGKLDQACKELAESLSKHDDSGTKGALATCYGKTGKLASAWKLWKDLADTAPAPELRSDAAREAAALEPRLPRYVIKAPAIPGLVVAIGASNISDFTVTVPLPIDPGQLDVSAKAPGYKPWSSTIALKEGAVTVVEVPALVQIPLAERPGYANYESDMHSRNLHHLVAYGLAGAGVVAMVIGGALGAHAGSEFSTAKSDCDNMIDACPGSGLAAANSAFKSAQGAANASTALFVVGPVLVAGAAVSWFTAPHAETAPTAMRVTPAVDGHSVGVVLSGGF